MEQAVGICVFHFSSHSNHSRLNIQTYLSAKHILSFLTINICLFFWALCMMRTFLSALVMACACMTTQLCPESFLRNLSTFTKSSDCKRNHFVLIYLLNLFLCVPLCASKISLSSLFVVLTQSFPNQPVFMRQEPLVLSFLCSWSLCSVCSRDPNAQL